MDSGSGSSSDKTRRVVAARLRLRDRFLDRMRGSPAMADERPLGGGPPNRHGMPKLPPDQTATAEGKWPILDLGVVPDVSRDAWRLTVGGACRSPVVLDWEAFQAIGPIQDTSDFHCVTGWSKLDVLWEGVRFADVAALSDPIEEAAFVVCHGADGYATNLPLHEALKEDVLLVHAADGRPLPREHGGPVRMITPQLWAWKGAKWIRAIEFTVEDRPGFWEQRGYSNTAHPWRNDRYA